VTGFEGLNQTRPANGIVPSDQLRLNMSTPVTETPDRLGVIGGDVQGFPNGRRLGDDVVDISVRVLEGALTDRDDNDLEDSFSDGVDENDVAFSETFPFVALPARGSDASPHDGAVVNRQSPSDQENGAFAGLPGSFPELPVLALGLGLLGLAAGVVGLSRRPRSATA
jgi:hypothetical protein